MREQRQDLQGGQRGQHGGLGVPPREVAATHITVHPDLLAQLVAEYVTLGCFLVNVRTADLWHSAGMVLASCAQRPSPHGQPGLFGPDEVFLHPVVVLCTYVLEEHNWAEVLGDTQ